MSTPITRTSPHTNHLIESPPQAHYSINIKGKPYEIRRLLLPLVAMSSLLTIDELYNFFYLPMVIFFIFFIIFWNFPVLVTFANMKPLYYEDLFIDYSKIQLLDVSPTKKKYFETVFHWSLIITNSLFISALSDYWLYKTLDRSSMIEVIGVTGGILKIFQLINHINGSIILQITRRFIYKEFKDKNIELTTLEHTTHIINIVSSPLPQLYEQDNNITFKILEK